MSMAMALNTFFVLLRQLSVAVHCGLVAIKINLWSFLRDVLSVLNCNFFVKTLTVDVELFPLGLQTNLDVPL